MAPKKNKVSLSSFLNDETTGKSWADEMDDMPTAPGEFEAAFGRSGGDRPSYGGRDAYGDRDARPPRPDVPFPSEPPYTAFVGNMSFECGQDDVSDFFTNEGLKVTNVRMITGYDGKPKGFCYAEFPEADMLKKALDLSGESLAGRTIRISVAEPPRADSAGRSAGDWTRSGPLADIPGRSSGGFARAGAGAGPGLTGGRPERGPPPSMDADRDWGAVRGGKFTPSEPSSPAMGGGRPTFGDRREPSSGGGRMGMGMGAGAGGFSRERDFSGSSAGGPPPAPAEDRDWTAARGSKFVPAPPAPERRPSAGPERRGPDADGARDWRARASPVSPAVSDSAGPASGPAPPVERKKLQLSARTASSTSPGPDASASPSTPSSKPNPFGGAAPVNTAQREEAVLEARRAKEKQEAEERKKAKEDAAAAAATAASASNGDDKAASDEKSEPAAQKSWRREQPAASDNSNSNNTDEQLSSKMSSAKIAESKSATPGKAWRRPAGPHSGLTDQIPNAPQSQVAKTAATEEKQPAQPRQFAQNQGLRKEGFSYSNIAAAKAAAAAASQHLSDPKPPTQPLASDNIVPETVPVKQKDGEGLESIA